MRKGADNFTDLTAYRAHSVAAVVHEFVEFSVERITAPTDPVEGSLDTTARQEYDLAHRSWRSAQITVLGRGWIAHSFTASMGAPKTALPRCCSQVAHHQTFFAYDDGHVMSSPHVRLVLRRVRCAKGRINMIEWRCSICNRDIEDGEGSLFVNSKRAHDARQLRDDNHVGNWADELSSHSVVHWRTTHDECEHPGLDDYWTAVEDLRTWTQLLTWVMRVRSKPWVEFTDLDDLVLAAAIRFDALE